MKKILFASLVIVLFTGCTLKSVPTVNDIEEQNSFNIDDENLEWFNINDDQENTLNLSMRNPLTLNPLLNEDKTVDSILKLMFEHLAVVDSTLRVIPNLAESFDFSEDGFSVLVNLRDDVYFSDEVLLTSDDLAFSIDFIKNTAPTGSIYKNTVSAIESYTKIDDFTLNVTLSEQAGGQAYMFCFPIIPSHYYRNETDPGSERNMAPLGTGAYKFENYTLVRELNLESNEDYFKGKVNIDYVRVLIIDDHETKLHAFEQGIIDAITTDVLNFSKYSGTRQAIINEFDTNYYDFIGFDFENVIFQDIRIREAISRLVNVNEMIDNVYLGLANRAYSVINPNSWLYEESLSVYEYNKEIAKNLFFQAGFTDDSRSGYMGRELSGVFLELDFRILVNEESEEKIKIANILRDNLYDIGVKSQVVILPFEEYEEKLRNSEFDLFVGSFNFSLTPSFTFAFGSSQIGAGGNFFNYRSQSLDGYLYNATIAADEESLIRSVSNIQKHIANEIVCISIAFRKQTLITDNRVRGVKSPVINNAYQDINLWLAN